MNTFDPKDYTDYLPEESGHRVALEMLPPDVRIVEVMYGDRKQVAMMMLYDTLRRELSHRQLFMSGCSIGSLGFGVCLFTVTERDAALAALRSTVDSTPAGPLSKLYWFFRDELIWRLHSGPPWPTSFLVNP